LLVLAGNELRNATFFGLRTGATASSAY